mmetsp:Transcript_161241/g.517650  ORF Transcript_161241/g.517650 Transcript_161241/m.517650 type:complete len:203 (+) Transcript_161241:1687-2295(+)
MGVDSPGVAKLGDDEAQCFESGKRRHQNTAVPRPHSLLQPLVQGRVAAPYALHVPRSVRCGTTWHTGAAARGTFKRPRNAGARTHLSTIQPCITTMQFRSGLAPSTEKSVPKSRWLIVRHPRALRAPRSLAVEALRLPAMHTIAFYLRQLACGFRCACRTEQGRQPAAAAATTAAARVGQTRGGGASAMAAIGCGVRHCWRC